MGQTPAKYFLPQIPFGASQANNIVAPSQQAEPAPAQQFTSLTNPAFYGNQVDPAQTQQAQTTQPQPFYEKFKKPNKFMEYA